MTCNHDETTAPSAETCCGGASQTADPAPAHTCCRSTPTTPTQDKVAS